jgi:hypothetical protein
LECRCAQFFDTESKSRTLIPLCGNTPESFGFALNALQLWTFWVVHSLAHHTIYDAIEDLRTDPSYLQ